MRSVRVLQGADISQLWAVEDARPGGSPAPGQAGMGVRGKGTAFESPCPAQRVETPAGAAGLPRCYENRSTTFDVSRHELRAVGLTLCVQNSPYQFLEVPLSYRLNMSVLQRVKIFQPVTGKRSTRWFARAGRAGMEIPSKETAFESPCAVPHCRNLARRRHPAATNTAPRHAMSTVRASSSGACFASKTNPQMSPGYSRLYYKAFAEAKPCLSQSWTLERRRR